MALIFFVCIDMLHDWLQIIADVEEENAKVQLDRVKLEEDNAKVQLDNVKLEKENAMVELGTVKLEESAMV